MFYKLYSDTEHEKILRPFVKNIENFCSGYELQFLNKEVLCWNIPCESDFAFNEFYYVNNKVPVFNCQVWEQAANILDEDEIFRIPVIIKYCGEQHYYTVALPSRINCLDSKGRILPGNVGRYHIFKSNLKEDNAIYVSEQMMKKLNIFPNLKLERVR